MHPYSALGKSIKILDNILDNNFCPCGGIILADTEDWKMPRCYDCSTEDDLINGWLCLNCKLQPDICVCEISNWV